MPHDEIEDHDRGLLFDLETLSTRRRMLGLLSGAGLLALVGCGTSNNAVSGGSTSTSSSAGSSSASNSAASSSSTDASTDATCVEEIPEETAGPFPGDGSNGPNVLTESGIVRSDITSSFGSSTTKADGVPLTIKLKIQDSDCAALAGAAVYLWHCNINGEYSMYSQAVTDENYLRGVQEADENGEVTFTSIFPAAYDGRWPHIHFEVYASLSEATAAGKISATSQIALPQDACEAVYATDGYEQSVQNLSRTSLETDNVFSDDGGVKQLATVSGSASKGYTAALTVGL